MTGQVYGIFNDLFLIKLNNQEKKIYAKSKGYLKEKKNFIFVGDWVELELRKEKLSLITKIIKRKNYLTKPLIANVDNVFLITAFKEPKLDFCFLNKILIWLEVYTDVKIFLLFTKKDLLTAQLADQELLKKVTFYQKVYCHLLLGKNNQNEIKLLMKKITGSVVFLGRSGVGKTTLINLLAPQLKLKTKTVSSKNKLGRHQTVISRYYQIDDHLVADSPGFNQQSLKTITKEELINHFSLLKAYQNKCFFANCSHDHEPNCQLKKAKTSSFEGKFLWEEWQKLLKQYKKDLAS